MGKLVALEKLPIIYNILEVRSDTQKLELFVDERNEQIKAEVNLKIIFEAVLDFRFSSEHGFLGRNELGEKKFKCGTLYEVNDSQYLKYYLSMFPASEYLHPNIKHYFIIDKFGNFGIDVLLDASYGNIKWEKDSGNSKRGVLT